MQLDVRMKNDQVCVRLSPDILARLDAYAAELDEERPGLDIGRAGAIKVLLATHLPKLSDQPTAKASAKPTEPTPAKPAKSAEKSAKPAKRKP